MIHDIAVSREAHTVPAWAVEAYAHFGCLCVAGNSCLTNDGSQMRVKDTGELTKMVDTNAP